MVLGGGLPCLFPLKLITTITVAEQKRLHPVAYRLLEFPIYWKAGLAQWSERSPPTYVARVQILDPVSYVG